MLSLFKKRPVILVLILIFGLALFLRLYKLGSTPITFHEDEVLNGYIGRFILQNGRDTYGNKWPLLYFNKFGDYYIILPLYLAGIATYLFGINEFATRFPSAFFGAMAVFPVFLLSYMTFKNKKVALLSALFSAIVPWQWVLSRSTTEGIIGSTIFLTGTASLMYSIKKQKLSFLILSCVLFLITYDIYHPFRIYTPLIFIPALLIFKEYFKKKKYLFYYLGSMVIFFALTFYISTTFWGKGRLIQTSIFSPISGVTIKINELNFSEGEQHILLARIFHNKLVGYTREFVTQYLSYFSPVYLFINGWKNTRYYVPEQGLMYLSFLIFFFVAVLPIRTKPPLQIDKKNFIFLMFLLFLAPIPAGFTVVESPNVHRALMISYLLVIVAAYGFYKSFFIEYKKISVGFILLMTLILEVIYFWHQYSVHMDLYASLIRNDGMKQVALYAGKQSKLYDEIYLPAEGAMSWYYLFYNRDFSSAYIGKFRLDARIDQTQKIHYVENSCPTNTLNNRKFDKRILVVDRYNCVSSDQFKQIDQIRGVNPLMTYRVLISKE